MFRLFSKCFPLLIKTVSKIKKIDKLDKISPRGNELYSQFSIPPFFFNYILVNFSYCPAGINQRPRIERPWLLTRLKFATHTYIYTYMYVCIYQYHLRGEQIVFGSRITFFFESDIQYKKNFERQIKK